MLAYLDDWLFLHSSLHGTREMIGKVLADCRKTHVQINFEKSHLSPSRRLEKHLGFTLDFSGSGTITVPQDRWDRLRQDILSLLRAADLVKSVPVTPPCGEHHWPNH